MKKSTLAAAMAVVSAGAIGITHRYKVECFKPDGTLRWVDGFDNLVVDVGLDEILEQFYKGSTYTASHFIGLTDASPTIAAGDTMASHVGWVELVPYSESVRQTFTPGTVSSQSVDNSASKAVFSINGTATIGGAFLTTDNAKSGTDPLLIGVGAFAADRAVLSGDTLNVTVTATASSS